MTHMGIDSMTHMGIDSMTHMGIESMTHMGIDSMTHILSLPDCGKTVILQFSATCIQAILK